MVWRRLPAILGNLPLKLMPLQPQQLQQIKETGWIREAAFRTTPNVNKVEIKAFLESVYDMQVERVSTINYLGKKKRSQYSSGKMNYYRLSDWKKAYVVFKPPQAAEQQQQAEQQPQLPPLPSSSALTQS